MRKKKQGDPTRAIAYIRVSTDEQDLGPDAQAAAITAWAARGGVTIVATFTDKGVSGALELDKRPGLLAALDALQIHKAGALVAAKRDRFARDVVVGATLERLAERQGARVVSADGTGDGTGPEAALMRRIVDAFAEYERQIIRGRTSAALRAAQRRGQSAGGRPPYGWRKIDKTLEPVPAEQQALERMRQLAADGRDCEEIARVLQTEGHPCRGQRWHRRTVGRALSRGDVPGGLSPRL